MKFNYALAPAIIGVSITLVQPQIAVALSSSEGAIADFNELLRIIPNDADTYAARGAIRSVEGDKQGAIADLQKATNLFLEQGNTVLYQKMLELIRQFQQ